MNISIWEIRRLHRIRTSSISECPPPLLALMSPLSELVSLTLWMWRRIWIISSRTMVHSVTFEFPSMTIAVSISLLSSLMLSHSSNLLLSLEERLVAMQSIIDSDTVIISYHILWGVGSLSGWNLSLCDGVYRLPHEYPQVSRLITLGLVDYCTH